MTDTCKFTPVTTTVEVAVLDIPDNITEEPQVFGDLIVALLDRLPGINYVEDKGTKFIIEFDTTTYNKYAAALESAIQETIKAVIKVAEVDTANRRLDKQVKHSANTTDGSGG